MTSSECLRCNNLRFSDTGESIQIDIPKWKQKREVEANPSHFSDWYVQQAKGEPTASCASCQLLWNGTAAVLGKDFSTNFNTMILKYIEPQYRGGPMTVTLCNSWDLRRKMIRSEPTSIHVRGGEMGEPQAKIANAKELQFYTSGSVGALEDGEETLKSTMVGKGHDISSSGGSDTCLSLARQWLDSCTTSRDKHAQCIPPADTELPTRVIDVEEMRLFCPPPGTIGRWASLSHCWGGLSPARTTVKNLDQHRVQLPEHLPRTFADALRVTKALGLRYLWIDSLCIIQASTEDWNYESAHMAKVYENAFFTISADAARDS